MERPLPVEQDGSLLPAAHSPQVCSLKGPSCRGQTWSWHRDLGPVTLIPKPARTAHSQRSWLSRREGLRATSSYSSRWAFRGH